jgi:hypothetical protein
MTVTELESLKVNVEIMRNVLSVDKAATVVPDLLTNILLNAILIELEKLNSRIGNLKVATPRRAPKRPAKKST